MKILDQTDLSILINIEEQYFNTKIHLTTSQNYLLLRLYSEELFEILPQCNQKIITLQKYGPSQQENEKTL